MKQLKIDMVKFKEDKDLRTTKKEFELDKFIMEDRIKK